ncbi:hypothetical protein AX16_002154 [Volvariella volvacea WC 439]|nr:hypothetical protein AX16_002154 [Volvariella volvacea WC 439]
MKFSEILDFDKYDYQEKISAPDYSYYKLAHNIYTKRRAITGSTVATGASVLSLGVTGGASLFGGAFSLRNRSVEKQKLKLLEREWERRGQPHLPERLRDMIIPIVLTTAAGMFMFSVNLGIENAMNPPPELVHAGWLTPMSAVEGFMVGAYYTAVEKGAHGIANKVTNRSGSKYKDYDDHGSHHGRRRGSRY